MDNSASPRTTLMNQIRILLGDSMIRVGIQPENLELAIDIAVSIYRQRSSNSVDERYAFLELQPRQSDYYLDGVKEVVKILRQGVGGVGSGAGVSFDPFGAAFINQTSTGLGNPTTGGLLTYHLYSSFVSTVGRLFGSEIAFTYNSQTHQLNIARSPRGVETVLLHVFVDKTEDEIITGDYSGPWIRDYATARAKMMVGEARAKFGNIPGPQGGSTMNGAEMKAEAQAEMERLINELKLGADQSMGLGFIIG